MVYIYLFRKSHIQRDRHTGTMINYETDSRKLDRQKYTKLDNETNKQREK